MSVAGVSLRLMCRRHSMKHLMTALIPSTSRLARLFSGATKRGSREALAVLLQHSVTREHVMCPYSQVAVVAASVISTLMAFCLAYHPLQPQCDVSCWAICFVAG